MGVIEHDFRRPPARRPAPLFLPGLFFLYVGGLMVAYGRALMRGELER